MPTQESRGDWEKSINSFSGCDILAMMGGQVVGEVQGVSYTTTREKAPNFVMGRTDPISYSRGKRGIAGAMIFLVFEKAALIHSMRDQAKVFLRQREVTQRNLIKEGAGAIAAQAFKERQTTDGRAVRSAVALGHAIYPDQIPPFNVVLVAENEYGGGATMSIVGAEILNDGGGVSVDDISTNQSMTYVATALRHWSPLVYVSPVTGQQGTVDDFIDRLNQSAAPA